ncbi:MAG: sulfite exporter TauE/SafE family protein [Acidimicrobiia bacterium]
MSDLAIIVLATLAGMLTGVLSGMFGVGGAIVSTPAIRALGAGPIDAVGSTLPSIFPASISGALRYRKEELLNVRVMLWTALSGVAASVGGALLVDEVPGDGHALQIFTAGLVAFSAVKLSRPPRRAEAPDELAIEGATDAGPGAEIVPDEGEALPVRDERWRLVATGIGAGGLSGLLGVGGGILMVPAFTGWVRLPLKEALGTSLACVGVLAIPGTITHALLGHIDWLYALPLAVGVVPGARLGSFLAIRSSDRFLRKLVGIVLGAIAVVYATGEILALI